MDLGGRKQLFKVLFGSHNYNLNTPEGDKDYKIFVLPTFDDLYSGKEFSTSHVGETEDYDVHDIRKVSHLWWKANINFLEVLFSEEGETNKNLRPETLIIFNSLVPLKHHIARMNLPYLYDACVGMHLNKKKLIDKGTEGTQHLVERYGYDTKQAMHSLRVLDFLKRFADNEFQDFKKAIWYDEKDPNKSWLLAVKYGLFSKEHYLKMADEILEKVGRYKELYKVQRPDEELKEHLSELVKGMVKEELF